MQSSICLEDVDEGAPKCRTVSTERDGQPPASEPPPVTANFEPPDGPDPPKSERPWTRAGAEDQSRRAGTTTEVRAGLANSAGQSPQTKERRGSRP